ncbi:phosphatidate cytidylyltransferase [soil metagenome]
MLKQRVITAVLLLLVLLPAMLAPIVWPFALLVLLAVAVAAWEWARLNGVAGTGALLIGLAVAVACGASFLFGYVFAVPSGLWWIISLAWVIGSIAALRAGVSGWKTVPKVLRLVLGMAALWAAWLALTNAKTIGINFLLSVLCLVWAADIAAYFGGKAFGRRKLAITISPGKSWEGAISGAIGVLVLAVIWIQLDRRFEFDSASIYSDLLERFGAVALVAAVLCLSALSVVGDLVESLVKRSAGAKDSSALLPGHGGLLDRVDALLPVLPFALALIHMPNLR